MKGVLLSRVFESFQILLGLERYGHPSIDPSDRLLNFSSESISRFTGTEMLSGVNSRVACVKVYRRYPLKGSMLFKEKHGGLANAHFIPIGLQSEGFPALLIPIPFSVVFVNTMKNDFIFFFSVSRSARVFSVIFFYMLCRKDSLRIYLSLLFTPLTWFEKH